MEIFRFDPQIGRRIEQYDSAHLVLTPLVHLTGEAQLGCMYLGPGGVVGYHRAVVPQLFLVVRGEGWVRGASPERTPISAGQAAFWKRGEGHAAGTDVGMTAIVIEGEGLRPAEFLPPLDTDREGARRSGEGA